MVFLSPSAAVSFIAVSKFPIRLSRSFNLVLFLSISYFLISLSFSLSHSIVTSATAAFYIHVSFLSDGVDADKLSSALSTIKWFIEVVPAAVEPFAGTDDVV